jgi:hypothetical protein
MFRYLKHTSEFGIWYPASFSLDLVGFFSANLWGVGLTERALLVVVIFWNLLLFASLLENNILLLNPSQRLSM